MAKLRALWLRVFDKGDAFKLLSAAKQVQNAERRVELTAAYETAAGSSLDLEFKGALDDAEPLKEFPESQFRAPEKRIDRFAMSSSSPADSTLPVMRPRR